MSDPLQIGNMIRFHRKIAKLSQHELAKLSSVGKTSIFDIEKGKKTVRLLTLLKILKTLNIDIEFKGPLMKMFTEKLNEKS
jgi:y4mF family transcriptional regulator